MKIQKRGMIIPTPIETNTKKGFSKKGFSL